MPRQAQPTTRQTGRNVKFDEEDDQVLIELARREKLTASDIIRRAVRAYAKQLGITQAEDQKVT